MTIDWDFGFLSEYWRKIIFFLKMWSFYLYFVWISCRWWYFDTIASSNNISCCYLNYIIIIFWKQSKSLWGTWNNEFISEIACLAKKINFLASWLVFSINYSERSSKFQIFETTTKKFINWKYPMNCRSFENCSRKSWTWIKKFKKNIFEYLIQ